MPQTCELQKAASIGLTRCDVEALHDSPLFIPDPPSWVDDKKTFLAGQLHVTQSHDALLMHYVELLHRAQGLMEFLHHNLGPTPDWPIQFMGDTEEAEECMLRRMDSLSTMVAFLEESSLS